MHIWLHSAASACFVAGRYEDAVDWATKCAEATNPPHSGAYRILAASYAHLNWISDARDAFQTLLGYFPGLTVDDIKIVAPWRDPADIDRFLEGLEKAGLSE